MKALVTLAQINPAMFSAARTQHAEWLRKRATIALGLDEDRHKLRQRRDRCCTEPLYELAFCAAAPLLSDGKKPRASC